VRLGVALHLRIGRISEGRLSSLCFLAPGSGRGLRLWGGLDACPTSGPMTWPVFTIESGRKRDVMRRTARSASEDDVQFRPHWRLFVGPNPTEVSRCSARKSASVSHRPMSFEALMTHCHKSQTNTGDRTFDSIARNPSQRAPVCRWADIDLEQRAWRLPITKAGRSHLLPLPSLAVHILKSLPSRGKSEWFSRVGARAAT
jgi:hypothetical protein